MSSIWQICASKIQIYRSSFCRAANKIHILTPGMLIRTQPSLSVCKLRTRSSQIIVRIVTGQSMICRYVYQLSLNVYQPMDCARLKIPSRFEWLQAINAVLLVLYMKA